MQLQWIYNASFRTFAPDQIVWDSANNRVHVSAGSTPEWEMNDFDVICPATFNTNEPQTPIIRFHRLFGRNQKTENRDIVNSKFPEFTEENRRVLINFNRPVGE